MDTLLILFGLFSILATALAGEYCYDGSAFRTKYCSYGCCGDYPDEYCCSVYAWAIVLAVIGGIIFISCVVVVVCCMYKKKGHNGRVMTTTAPATVTTINYAQPGFHPGAQPYGYMPPPPGYQQQPGFQPQPPPYASGSQYPPPDGAQQNFNPAFPPPPPKY